MEFIRFENMSHPNYNNWPKWLLGFVLFFLTLSVLVSCEKKPRQDENVVILIDGYPMKLTEFRNYYELDPTFPGYIKGQSGLREYAEFLSDRFLTRKLARREGLFHRLPFRRYLTFERNKAIIREYYRKQVADTIKITEAQIQSALNKMRETLRVKHLYVPERHKAFELYRSLQSGISFDTLEKQVFAGVDSAYGGADLGEVSFGDLDPALEAVAYQLKPGDFSPPVQSRWGYHILLLVDRKPNTRWLKLNPEVKRRKIIGKLKRIREEQAARDYLKHYLDPLNITVKRDAFLKIITQLDLPEQRPIRLNYPRNRYLSDEQLNALRTALEEDLNEIFMTSSLENWSIGDFLTRLDDLPPDKRPQLNSVAGFKEDIGILIRDAFLLKDALKQRMDRSAPVDSTVRSEEMQMSYQYYLKMFYEQFEVDSLVQNYFQNQKSAGGLLADLPPGVLPGMASVEGYRLYHARRKLHAFLRSEFPEVEITINDSLIAREAKTIDWEHPVRMVAVPQYFR
ncbi:MAG: hypothetical protein Kow0042_00620 [Calditrichia bacterium]